MVAFYFEEHHFLFNLCVMCLRALIGKWHRGAHLLWCATFISGATATAVNFSEVAAPSAIRQTCVIVGLPIRTIRPTCDSLPGPQQIKHSWFHPFQPHTFSHPLLLVLCSLSLTFKPFNCLLSAWFCFCLPDQVKSTLLVRYAIHGAGSVAC